MPDRSGRGSARGGAGRRWSAGSRLPRGASGAPPLRRVALRVAPAPAGARRPLRGGPGPTGFGDRRRWPREWANRTPRRRSLRTGTRGPEPGRPRPVAGRHRRLRYARARRGEDLRTREAVSGDVIEGRRARGSTDRGPDGPRLPLGVVRRRRPARPVPAAVARDLPRRVRGPAAGAAVVPGARDRGLAAASSPSASRSWSRGWSTAGSGRSTSGRSSSRSRRRACSRRRGSSRGAGVGTLCLGAAFLFIAAVRWVSGGGIGWQAALGVVLAVIGAASARVPGLRRPGLAAGPGDRRRRAPVPGVTPGVSATGAAARAASRASPSPSAIRRSSSSVITNGGPRTITSPSVPFALPVPE